VTAGRAALRAVLLAAAIAAGCGPRAGDGALDQLDRLAFVPAGQVYVSAFLPIVLYEAPEALLVERFESTRAQWAEFARSQPEALAPEMLARVRAWPQEQGAWPATWMTQPEAARFAAWRGMRLLRPGEWLLCALGQERRLFPWVAYERQDSVANTLELGLGRPCPVGTFEGGRTPRQVYDLLGNVAEWVDGSVLDGEPVGPPDPERAVSALGGSFRTWLRPIYRPLRSGDAPERAYLAYELHPRSRQDDVGVRCAVAAAGYLESAARRWDDDAATRARLVKTGRRWGRAAAPLLAELSARPGAPPGLAALLEGAQQ
jgi:hypothetical protein